MKVLPVLASLAAAGSASVIPTGKVAGPVHPAVGPIVATKRGPAHIGLEGFSEDDNQDGFVDPVGQVAPVVAYAHAPVVNYAHAPVVNYAHAPVVSYTHTAPVVAPVAPVVTVKAAETKVVEPVKVDVKAAEIKPVEIKPVAINPAPGVAYTLPQATGVAVAPYAAITHHPTTLIHHTAPVTTTYTHTVPVGTQVYSYSSPLIGGLLPASAATVKIEEPKIAEE